MDDNDECRTVGSWLRAARESRGESLDDVARITRIGKGYLEALELGEMHKLPSEAYTKGFVRLYANHLGLSGDEAVARLRGRSESSAVAREPDGSGNVSRGEPVIRMGEGSYRRWAIPCTLLLFLVLFATFSRLKNNASGPTTPVPPAPAQQTPAVAPVPPPVPSQGAQPSQPLPPDNAEPAPQPAEAAPAGGIILRLKVVQTGKLHITIDGAVSQEYELNVGDLVEWKAEKMLLLELDNAGSVEGDINGRQLGPLGEPGRAVHLVIDANGVRQQ